MTEKEEKRIQEEQEEIGRLIKQIEEEIVRVQKEKEELEILIKQIEEEILRIQEEQKELEIVIEQIERLQKIKENDKNETTINRRYNPKSNINLF
jgi:hypothetical protein